jgi:hypothetical protein
MVGISTSEKIIRAFRFILLADPNPALRRTDRIYKEEALDPLLGFFADELS